jgi:hypothetical protein
MYEEQGTKGKCPPGYMCATTRRHHHHHHHETAVLSGTRIVRVLCVCVATLCCRVAGVSAGDAAECARWRLTAHGSASTKRFLCIMMPMKRDCAKSVRESNNDLTMLKSWISAIIRSVAWSIAPLLASSCLLHVRADGEEGDGEAGGRGSC